MRVRCSAGAAMSVGAAAATAPPPDAADAAHTRFIAELEFVSLLADPAFVSFSVAQFLSKPGFSAYLGYLATHWPTPAYARHVRHPAGLLHLRLLVEDAGFRAAAADGAAAAQFKAAQLDAWRAAAAPPPPLPLT